MSKTPSTATTLLSLIKPVSPPSSSADLTPRFTHIAHALLSSYLLIAGTAQFRLREIEFYASPLDQFAHGEEDQTVNGRWYFHQRGGKRDKVEDEADDATLREETAESAPRKRKFIEGTRKGLDLAFSGFGLRGGILIRTIQRVGSAEVVSGPSLVVETICSTLLTAHPRFSEISKAKFRGSGVVRALVEDILLASTNQAGLDATDPTNVLRLELNTAQLGAIEIHTSPRIGMSLLKLAQADSRLAERMIEFFGVAWRFVSGDLKDVGKGCRVRLSGF